MATARRSRLCRSGRLLRLVPVEITAFRERVRSPRSFPRLLRV